MTPKQRVLKAINHQETGRPPIFANFTPQVAEKMAKYLNIPYEPPEDSMLSTRISHPKLLTSLGNDCVGIAACAPDNAKTYVRQDGMLVNEWGMVFKNVGLYNEFYEYPLEHAQTAGEIESYSFPDIHAPGRYDHAKTIINTYGQEYAIVADLETSIFETAWYLTGLEKFLMDLMLETPYIEPLMDKIMHINTETGKELIRPGADIIWAGDDFGTQQGMVMDPETWRKFFKPRIKFMFEEFRKVNPDIKIAWHSCGSILPIIPDFIEIGLDILNPIQPLAKGMQPEFLKSTYGNDLVFFGGIDVQELLPHSTPEKIEKEIKRIAGIYGQGGGYIAAPAHNVQNDTPVENIMAMFEAVKKMS